MSKYLKYIMIASLGLLLTNCASSTYTIKKEGNLRPGGTIDALSKTQLE